MTAVTFSQRIEDSVGPIVVKEVRQGLRAKVFAIFFGLLLSACLVVALVAVSEAADRSGGELGRGFLAAYLAGLGAVCFFVIPFIAFRSMLREREDETWVLLVLTGLGGRNIVRGKWVSAMSQALLFASACAPFVVFSYFLNGIDLPQILLPLLLSAGWTCLLTGVGIAIATQAHSRLGRTFAHFVALAVLGAGTFAGIGLCFLIADEGNRVLRQESFINFAAGIFVMSLALTVLVLEGAAAGLALASEPASRGPRKALLGVMGVAWGFGLLAFLTRNGTSEAAAAGSVLTSVFLVIAGFFAVSEKDGWPRGLDSGGLLKPGAVRSFWLILLLLAGSTILWAALFGQAGHDGSGKRLRTLLGAPLYPALYLSLAAFVGRISPLKRLGEPIATRAAFVLMVSLGAVIPPVVSLVLGGRADDRAINALNPIIGMANFIDRSSSTLDGALVFLAATTLLFVFLGLVALGSRDGERTT